MQKLPAVPMILTFINNTNTIRIHKRSVIKHNAKHTKNNRHTILQTIAVEKTACCHSAPSAI